MAVLKKILDVLSGRIASLVGGAVASRIQTMVVLDQVDQQDELEERALQLEREGKSHLADAIRQRAIQVDHSNPGGQGQAIISQLCDESQPESMPAMIVHESKGQNEEAEPNVAEQSEPEAKRKSDTHPKRRKRATRRTSSPQPETVEESTDE